MHRISLGAGVAVTEVPEVGIARRIAIGEEILRSEFDTAIVSFEGEYAGWRATHRRAVGRDPLAIAVARAVRTGNVYADLVEPTQAVAMGRILFIRYAAVSEMPGIGVLRQAIGQVKRCEGKTAR